MNWFKPLDEYCERISPELWAEPINAISNISFILAAFLLYQLAKRLNVKSLGSSWLVVILLAIGVGSFLYHTFANLWSLFLDLLPIYLFQLSVMAFYGAAMARQVGFSQVLGVLALLSCFIAVSFLFAQFPAHIFNGSIKYFPALISLLFLGCYQAKYCIKERYTLITASALFVVSLFFRSVDMQVCNSFSLGTHFLWHLINACVLYLVIRAYMGILVSEKFGSLNKHMSQND